MTCIKRRIIYRLKRRIVDRENNRYGLKRESSADM
jgi:hypothetical protein